MSRRSFDRKAISVIDLHSGLDAGVRFFLVMYKYPIRDSTMASEAERLYAEAAQERLDAILDRRGRSILVNNTGGIGVEIRYLVAG